MECCQTQDDRHQANTNGQNTRIVYKVSIGKELKLVVDDDRKSEYHEADRLEPLSSWADRFLFPPRGVVESHEAHEVKKECPSNGTYFQIIGEWIILWREKGQFELDHQEDEQSCCCHPCKQGKKNSRFVPRHSHRIVEKSDCVNKLVVNKRVFCVSVGSLFDRYR